MGKSAAGVAPMLDYAALKIARGGRELYKSIENAKSSIVVVSPWLSEDLAELLLKKHMEGVDVRILTSNDCSVEEHKRALEKLILVHKQVLSGGSRLLRSLGLAMLLTGIVFTLLPIVASPLPAFLESAVRLFDTGLRIPVVSSIMPVNLSLVGLAILGTLVYGAGLAKVRFYGVSKLGSERLRVYSPPPFINLRVFVVDETVFTGSPSLGIKRSGGSTVESMMIVRNSELRKRLVEAIENLESSFSLRRVPIEKVGLELKKPCKRPQFIA